MATSNVGDAAAAAATVEMEGAREPATPGVVTKKAKLEFVDNGRLRVLEFYSGIGGMHCAFDESGKDGDVLAAFDINTTANHIYAHNFPKTKLHNRNIEALSQKQYDKFRATTWLMSPPCQPFTRQGKQEGSQDNRCKSFLYLTDLLGKLEVQRERAREEKEEKEEEEKEEEVERKREDMSGDGSFSCDFCRTTKKQNGRKRQSCFFPFGHGNNLRSANRFGGSRMEFQRRVLVGLKTCEGKKLSLCRALFFVCEEMCLQARGQGKGGEAHTRRLDGLLQQAQGSITGASALFSAPHNKDERSVSRCRVRRGGGFSGKLTPRGELTRVHTQQTLLASSKEGK